jgi:1-acyl-sn-glycerol-3-phosphate acyltransferase
MGWSFDIRRPFQVVGFVFYLALVLLPVPALLLGCSVVHRALGRLTPHPRPAPAVPPIDFYQRLVDLCTWMLCIRHSFVPSHSHIAQDRAILLASHRSWFDFALDNHLTHAVVVSRNIVQYVMLLAGALQVYERRVVRFHRRRCRKDQLYALVILVVEGHLRQSPRPILLYPEWTRSRHTHLSNTTDARSTLKLGLLSMIYDRGEYPVQVVISSNKERVVDELSLTIRLGVPVRTYVGTLLHPKAFDTFDGFIDAIAAEWYEGWQAVHRSSDDPRPHAAPSTHVRNTIALESLL